LLVAILLLFEKSARFDDNSLGVLWLIATLGGINHDAAVKREAARAARRFELLWRDRITLFSGWSKTLTPD
jgi:hypothetical protein